MFRSLFGALVGAALLATPALAKDKLTIVLDWFVNPNHGPLIIAQERGYYEAAGLDVTIIPPADAALPPAMVAAGRADLAISYQPQLHLQVAEGLDLIRVGTLVVTPLNCILVKADGPVKSIKDLKGRKIGYSVQNVDYAVTSAMLKPSGLTLDDVSMVDVAFSLTPALLTDQVDAVIGAYRNFELTQMKLEGSEGRCFFIEDHGVPAYEELIYVARGSTMRADAQKRDAVRRFLAATERATQFMVNEPEASWELFKKTSKELDNKLNRAAWFATLPRFSLRPAAADPARYVAFARFLLDAGLIKEMQKAEKLVMDVGATD